MGGLRIAVGAVHAWLVLISVALIPTLALRDLALYRSWVGGARGRGPW